MKKFQLVVLSSTLLLLVTSIFTVAEQQEDTAADDASAFLIDVPLDLPPLPQHVLRWGVDDVQRWMRITIGYPEFEKKVKAYLIDGPTLLTMRVEDVFAPAHAAQTAKLKAHQKLLRGQCLCGGQSTAATIWTYLGNNAGSTLFHLGLAAFSPRIGFASAVLTAGSSGGLACCAFGSTTSAGDVDAVAQLEKQYLSNTGGGSSDSSSSSSSSSYACGLESNAVTEAMCSKTPSGTLWTFAMLMPFAVYFWYGLAAFSTHPLLAGIWLFAFLVMQVIEVLAIVEFVAGLLADRRQPGGGAGTVAYLKNAFFAMLAEELAHVKDPFFWLVPGGLVVGYLLPAWVSYGVGLLLTGVVAFLILRIVLNLLSAFFGGPRPGQEREEHEQQQQQQQHQQQHHGHHAHHQ